MIIRKGQAPVHQGDASHDLGPFSAERVSDKIKRN